MNSISPRTTGDRKRADGPRTRVVLREDRLVRGEGEITNSPVYQYRTHLDILSKAKTTQ